MRARLREAAAGSSPADATAIFCSEHCHSRLTTAEEVAALRDFLGGVLRRRPGQRLPAPPGPGGAQPLLDPAEERRHRQRRSCRGPTRTIPTSTTTARWRCGRTRFGRGERARPPVRPRASSWAATSSATSSRPGTSAGPEPYVPVPTRTSRSAAGAGVPAPGESAARADRRPADRRGARAARPPGWRSCCPGRGARPSRAEAEAFYAMYRASNEALRQRHFPDRASALRRGLLRLSRTSPTRWTSRSTTSPASRRSCRPPRPARPAASRPRSRSATRACTGCATSRRPRSWRSRRALALVARTTPRPTARSPRTCCARTGSTRRSPPQRAPSSTGRTSHEYWHFLGILRRRTGDLDGAAEAQRQALARAPDHAGAQAELAQIDSRQNGRRVRCLPASSKRGRSLPKTTFSLTGDALAALDASACASPACA